MKRRSLGALMLQRTQQRNRFLHDDVAEPNSESIVFVPTPRVE